MAPSPSSRRRPSLRRLILRLATGLSAVYGLCVLTLVALEDRLIFHPVPADRRWNPPPPGFPTEEMFLPTDEGSTIHARWFPCPGAKGAVLVCHGRSENVSMTLGTEELTGWHREFQVSVLVFDYPGYGRSGGRPSESGCYAAADAAYDCLTHDKDVEPDRVLLFGASLGSAVAVDLASRQPHRALILACPPSSLPDVAACEYPFVPTQWLMRNRFDSLTKIARCLGPVFIVHGTTDSLVPLELGEKLFRAANEPKQLLRVKGARHGGCITPAFFPALRQFLKEVEVGDENFLSVISRPRP